MIKKALVIGINDYPGSGNDLNGCVNDAMNWKSHLESLGFIVTMLLDEQATRQGIKIGLNNLLVSNPDIAVATYSGHGTQVLDTSGDEPDGYDEALYVYDGELVDDELREIIVNTRNKQTSLICIIDSCFSGTVTRMLPSKQKKAVPRFIPNPKLPKGFPRARRMFEYEMPEILLSGSTDSEYSYDAFINGKWCGAFSHYALNGLRSGPFDMTWKWLHNNIGLHLPSASYPQHPQLEGTEDHKNSLVFTKFNSNEPPIEPDPPEEDPPPPDPVPWWKTFWNSLFGWLWYWKNIK